MASKDATFKTNQSSDYVKPNRQMARRCKTKMARRCNDATSKAIECSDYVKPERQMAWTSSFIYLNKWETIECDVSKYAEASKQHFCKVSEYTLPGFRYCNNVEETVEITDDDKDVNDDKEVILISSDEDC